MKTAGLGTAKFSAGQLAIFLLPLLAVLCVYGRSVGFAFLTWDDDQNVVANPWLLHGELGRFWREPFVGMYVPEVYTVWFALSRLVQPLSPALFHGVNLLVHILNTYLVYALAWRFSGGEGERERTNENQLWAAAAALLFALHPLQVETVSWVTGLRDLLSTFWSLLALGLFLSAGKRRGYMIAAFAAYVLALLCKPAAVVLPAALLVFSLLRREPKRSLWQLVPWALLVVPVVMATSSIQTEVISFAVPPLLLWQRLLVALDSFGFYFIKAVFPLGLAVDYGRTPGVALSGVGLLATLSAVAVGVFLAGVALWRRWLDRWAWGWLLFAAAALAPTSGIVPFAFQHTSTVADHYMYLPLAGFALTLVSILRKAPKVVGGGVVAACLAFWTVATLQRLPLWSSDQTLYPAMLADNKASYAGQIGMASLLMRAEHYTEALPYLQAAEALEPHNITTLLDKWLALVHLGRYREVIADVPGNVLTRPQIAANPNSASTLAAQYVVLAYAQVQTGDLTGSLATFCLANFADPTNPDVHNFLSFIAGQLQRPADVAQLCPAG